MGTQSIRFTVVTIVFTINAHLHLICGNYRSIFKRHTYTHGQRAKRTQQTVISFAYLMRVTANIMDQTKNIQLRNYLSFNRNHLWKEVTENDLVNVWLRTNQLQD